MQRYIAASNKFIAILFAGIGLLTLLSNPPVILIVVSLLIFAVMLKVWAREYLFLMSLGDNAFPGAHDKLIWAALMIVLPPVGGYLFHTYRETHWPERKANPGTDHDLL